MNPIENELKYTFFELSGPFDFTIVEPPKQLLMSFVKTSFLSFAFADF